MRLANLAGRAVVITGGRDGADPLLAADIGAASDGAFGPTPADVYAGWTEFSAWAASADGAARLESAAGHTVTPAELSAPSPSPRQTFGIALNYPAHAAEGHYDVPDFPGTFTKFATSLTGPHSTLELSGDTVDWEVELVVVIGATAKNVSAERAWEHVAGVTVGQDFSDRTVQKAGPAPQFSLGKSFPGYGPTGPWLVTPDEVPGLGLQLTCEVNGRVVQQASTDEMVFDPARLIEIISGICTLFPGDLIFTGTPSGVAMAGNGPYLRHGDHVVSRIQSIGELHTDCVVRDTARHGDASVLATARA
ncbi:fumarylacetoacetate hydrolase family protein [Jatrophihabitans endophyticus]|uniref:fumarylacetoacetate hydrolase family protein n=1 Tax=Jatrophihabitans endophyticus TaxID=1206085 RepID=UPI0019F12FA5|nr:fumarylacetoacetate hydrolase family protein [Jatrophihabitans endophyticus]MBE7190276.1 fumarylacetoacetate hydrolase family protein [Jatrophihabitans endophyticus]